MTTMLAIALFAQATTAAQATPPTPAATPAQLEANQRAALAHLSRFDGIWRGASVANLPDGTKRELTATYRSGPMLGGAMRLNEGRSYRPDGQMGLNLIGITEHDPVTGVSRYRVSYGGKLYDHKLTMTPTGYTFVVTAPNGATNSFTVSVEGDRWTEIAMRTDPGKTPVEQFRMSMTRVAKTDWPIGVPLGPKP